MTSESGHTRTIPATLEPGGNLAQTIAHTSPVRFTGERGMKFEYASGSRPLEGFTIKRGVGIGGFGEVYFAISDAGKEVALKRVQRNLDIEVRGVSQCLNLKHGNLIGLFDIKYDDEGGAWVVMEYVGGESLRDMLDRNQNGMPIDEALHWFKEIAAGVAYLHDHGIVHRDLKPGNIFCDEGTIKIGDYGLSKFISCSRRSGQTESVGTCHYMAPEIGKGVYGKEIDVYALGIILFEMITGRLPFEGESSQEIIMKHLTAEPELGAVPQPFRSVIRKTLFKDPARRYGSVPEMISDLESGGPADDDSDAHPDGGIVTSHMARDPEVPPVITQPASDNEPIYIDDDNADEMIFGPVRHVPQDQQKQHRPNPPGAQRVASAVPVGIGLPHNRQEPIAGAVRQSVGGLNHWWNNSNLSNPIKVLLVIAALFAVALNSEMLVPIAIIAGATYLLYFGIRAWNMAGISTLSSRGNLESDCRSALARRPVVQSFAELTGSLLTSSLVAAIMIAAMMVIGDEAFRDFGGERDLSRFAWLTLVSVSGAWSVLLLSKLWTKNPDDSVPRRLVMGFLGVALGAGAFFSDLFLRVPLPPNYHLDAHLIPRDIQQALLHDGATPSLLGQIVFFGGLFAILRWWKQADPLRRTRTSLFATAACVLWSWIIPYPQPWGFMIAAATSIAIQMSAPWLNRPQQVRLAQAAA